jgi:hypothetical protein
MHAEDIARAGASATATEATERATRQTTLYLETEIIPRTTLELGGIMASTEKVDDEFDYVDDDGNIVRDKIEFSDTFGGKAKVTINAVRGLLYGAVNYAGLVADGGSPFREFDTQLPYSSLGNKIVYEGGYMLNLGNVMIYPRGLYRENLIEANPIIEPVTDGSELHPGIDPRNRESDPFAVLDNRKAISGELFFTYDPTPASSFYVWDSDKREDSKLAFNVGVNATQYEEATDSYLFFYQEGNTNAPFGKGLPAEDVWLAKSRIVMNPNPNLRIITNLSAGFQQSTGAPDGDAQEYYGIEGKVRINNKHIFNYYVKKDDWGPYDWYRQFNITYPYQYKLDYSVLIDNFMDELKSSKLGIKALYRTLDENSPGDEYNHGENEYMFEISTYYKLAF